MGKLNVIIVDATGNKEQKVGLPDDVKIGIIMVKLVEKIKQHYPDIDVEWLIFGKGNASVVNNEPQSETAISHEELKLEIEEEVVDDLSNNNTVNEYQAVYIAETPRKTDEKQKELNIPNQLVTETKRSVKKVILLYDDGSFEEFNK